MNKIKKNLFSVIFFILTMLVVIFLVLLNIQNYLQQKCTIFSKLEINLNENTKFLDSIIYSVSLDKSNSIKKITNHSNNNITIKEIKKIAKKILLNPKNKKIGFLYLNDYSYKYKKGKYLLILDNTSDKKSLLTTLLNSFLILFLMEIIIFLLSKHITKWIIRPVAYNFNRQKLFIEDASHELKTPLSVIIASADALEDNINEKKWLNNIKYEADRMNLLITNLLELAASEKKELLHIEKSNLSKTVELSVLAFEGIAFEKNIKLKYEIEEDIIFNFDKNSIKQLIEILLDNAIKHSNKNEIVRLNLKSDNKKIIIEVKNRGIPIPVGEENKIFERFYRVDKSRSRKENRYGLGLAIAKNIVINHNGIITANSQDGLTTLKIILNF